MSELPKGWTTAPLADVSEFGPSAALAGVEDAQLVHFVPMAAVSENFAGVDTSQLRPLSEVRKGYTPFIEGDVLFAKITPCMENGKGGLVPTLSHSAAFGSTEFHVLRPSQMVWGEWLAYFLSQPSFRKLARSNMTGTAGQMRVPTKWLKAVEINVPPRAEQTRIVAKLEELLSDLDAGVAELKAAQRKLKQYRQSLLKAAVEGALTAQWRAQNPAAETGAQLLLRILTERRARWEAQQLAKFEAQGKVPTKGWQGKYVEPVAPETSDLPALPQGWEWVSLDQLTEFITSGSRGWADYYADTGATFIRSQDINKDRLELSDCAYVKPPGGAEGQRTRVLLDDLLLTITGANVGKAARVDVELNDAYVSQHVALLRPVQTWMSEYLHLFLTAAGGGRGQLNKAAYGAGKPGLNLGQVGGVAVPLPGEAETIALVACLNAVIASCSEQEAAISAALRQSTAQRQNILRAAFAGQLVPQDPHDEPASTLLARIRAERAGADKPARARKPRTNKETA